MVLEGQGGPAAEALQLHYDHQARDIDLAASAASDFRYRRSRNSTPNNSPTRSVSPSTKKKGQKPPSSSCGSADDSGDGRNAGSSTDKRGRKKKRGGNATSRALDEQRALEIVANGKTTTPCQ